MRDTLDKIAFVFVITVIVILALIVVFAAGSLFFAILGWVPVLLINLIGVVEITYFNCAITGLSLFVIWSLK